jgi:hypothetical protein
MSHDNGGISRRNIVAGLAGMAALGASVSVPAAEDAPKDERRMKAEFSSVEDRNKAMLDLQKERKEFAYVSRLVAVRITNSSALYVVNDALFEAIDESPVIVEGFQRNTGLIPVAFELNPGESKTTFIPAATKVQPTSALCHITWRYIPSGFESRFIITTIKAPPAIGVIKHFLGMISFAIDDPVTNYRRDDTEPPSPRSIHDFKPR